MAQKKIISVCTDPIKIISTLPDTSLANQFLTALAQAEITPQIEKAKAILTIYSKSKTSISPVALTEIMNLSATEIAQLILDKTHWYMPQPPKPLGEVKGGSSSLRELPPELINQIETLSKQKLNSHYCFYFDPENLDTIEFWHKDSYFLNQDSPYISITFSPGNGGTEFLVLPEFKFETLISRLPKGEYRKNDPRSVNRELEIGRCLGLLLSELTMLVLEDPTHSEWLKKHIRRTEVDMVYSNLPNLFFHRSPAIGYVGLLEGLSDYDTLQGHVICFDNKKGVIESDSLLKNERLLRIDVEAITLRINLDTGTVIGTTDNNGEKIAYLKDSPDQSLLVSKSPIRAHFVLKPKFP